MTDAGKIFKRLLNKVLRLEKNMCCINSSYLKTVSLDVAVADVTQTNTIQVLNTGEVDLVDSTGTVTVLVAAP